MARYFYARVSTREQNLDRQLIVARDYQEPIDRIFTDRLSGRTMDRAEYQEMKSLLKEGDEVVIKDLDRLGRNKTYVKEEIEWFKDHGVKLRVLNLPTTMIDFPGAEWVADMVNNILIEVMASIAQNELNEIHRRQREGIDAMEIVKGKHISSRTGSGFGVEPYEVPGFEEAYARVRAGRTDARTEWENLGICKSKWYRLVKQFTAA